MPGGKDGKLGKSGMVSLRSIVEREGLKTQLAWNKTLLASKEGFLPKIEKNVTSERNIERPSSRLKRQSSQ